MKRALKAPAIPPRPEARPARGDDAAPHAYTPDTYRSDADAQRPRDALNIIDRNPAALEDAQARFERATAKGGDPDLRQYAIDKTNEAAAALGELQAAKGGR